MFYTTPCKNTPDILSCDSNVAIVLYGEDINNELIDQYLEICSNKFKSFQNITYFYEIINESAWDNLYRTGFKKRKFEIDNKMEFDNVIAINLKSSFVLLGIPFDNVKCPDFSLTYFSGFYNNSSYKTSIDELGFYCISRIFDVVLQYNEVKEKIKKLATDDKAFGDDSPEHMFYYYLKTLNLKTYCAHPLAFKVVTK